MKVIEEKTVAAIPVRITFASLHTKWLSYYDLLHFVFKMFVSVINGLAIYGGFAYSMHEKSSRDFEA